MSYTIETSNRFFAEIRRVVDEQTEKAIASLREEADVHEAVHDARKRCKKIRAAWRLIRDDLGEEAYQERNTWYRDTARLLSDLRDAKAMLETVELMRDRFGDVVYKSAFNELIAAFEARLARYEADHAGETPEPVGAAAERLEAALETLNPIEVEGEDWEGVAHSLRRVYKRGYRAFQQLREAPDPNVIHEWRKRTKYLRYQLRLLKRVWPGIINPWRDELHALSDLQGDHHDLHEFKGQLRRLEGVKDRILESIEALADKEQERLYRQMLPPGARLYAETPDAFARRLHSYLQAWDREFQEADAVSAG